MREHGIEGDERLDHFRTLLLIKVKSIPKKARTFSQKSHLNSWRMSNVMLLLTVISLVILAVCANVSLRLQ